MSLIVICSQCGFQTESSKKFCPNCGAPISMRDEKVVISPSSRGVAASNLFSVLQDKKINDSVSKTTPAVQSTASATPIIVESERKAQPKTFRQKPLGVAKPSAVTPVAPAKVVTKDIKNQLISFLRELNKLDRNLEASAVVKRNGTLLASAHSSRAKPEMMATISSTLYGIAKDSISAISGGKMRMVTITAEQIVLMLTHINEETILLLVTSPKSNLGLISMYSELVAQNIAKFLSKTA